jgi:hypothetical protein
VPVSGVWDDAATWLHPTQQPGISAASHQTSEANKLPSGSFSTLGREITSLSSVNRRLSGAGTKCCMWSAGSTHWGYRQPRSWARFSAVRTWTPKSPGRRVLPRQASRLRAHWPLRATVCRRRQWTASSRTAKIAPPRRPPANSSCRSPCACCRCTQTRS